MSYKVVIDSCGEQTDEMKKSGLFERASLTIDVDGYMIVDDETYDQADYLKRAAASPNSPKSSCPSPEAYMNLYEGDAERVYAVTLSSELSGSYNSAVLGMNLYKEEHEDDTKQIYVFNSRSASTGETLIGMKIQECEEAGMSFQEVVDTVEAYIDTQITYFVLETLDTLRKNGRLTGVKAVLASALNIKPVMSANKQGVITQLGQARGMKKGLLKMIDHIIEGEPHPEEKILAISHCNCPERAENVKKILAERAPFKEIIVNDTCGISSMYASDGGIIVTV